MERLNEIAIIILDYGMPIPTFTIAEKLGVSVKTVRNDLKKLEDVIGKEGLVLVKKSGVGNSIEGSEENKQLFLQTLKDNKDKSKQYSTEGRQKYILDKLFLNNNNKITSTSLAEELFISTSAIYRDLKQIEIILDTYNLKIISDNDGYISIKGAEKDYRLAISNLVFHENNDYLNEWDDINSRIDHGTRLQLEKLMDIDYTLLESHINTMEEKLGFRFSQDAYLCLVTHITIALKRIKSGKDIILTDETLDGMKDTKEYTEALAMSESLGRKLNVVIPEQEVGYITLHVLGGKIGAEEYKDLDIMIHEVRGMDEAFEIAKKMIRISGDTLGVDLSNDTVLLKALAIHLRPTINRLKYGLSLRNPLLEDIKQNYPDVFGVAWILGKVLKDYLDVPIPESEIGYIALHIVGALERNLVKIKTLIICHSGYGTSQLISDRLKRSFKELDIIGVHSSSSLNEELLKQTDIIISTVPLSINTTKPIFMISPLFTIDDVKKVELLIQNFKKNKKDSIEINVGKEVFIRTKSFSDKEEVLDDLCDGLYLRNYISKGFKKSVIDRENLFSTEVGKGIVVPHGDPKQVKRSFISLTLLKNPIRWDKEIVEFVLLISFKEEEIKYAKEIYVNLSNLMDDDEFLKSLKKGQMSALDRLIK